MTPAPSEEIALLSLEPLCVPKSEIFHALAVWSANTEVITSSDGWRLSMTKIQTSLPRKDASSLPVIPKFNFIIAPYGHEQWLVQMTERLLVLDVLTILDMSLSLEYPGTGCPSCRPHPGKVPDFCDSTKLNSTYLFFLFQNDES